MRYPKTSVPVPETGLKTRFKGILATYDWADLWLELIAEKLGEQWLFKKLKKWRWSLSTAFSGVGAAESVSWQFDKKTRNHHLMFHFQSNSFLIQNVT